MRTEPLITVGSITAIVAAILVFLRSFGVDITEDQQEAIRNLVAVLAPIVLALIARQYVFAPATVDEIKLEEFEAGQKAMTPPSNPDPKSYVSLGPGVRPREGIRRQTNPGS